MMDLNDPIVHEIIGAGLAVLARHAGEYLASSDVRIWRCRARELKRGRGLTDQEKSALRHFLWFTAADLARYCRENPGVVEVARRNAGGAA